MGDRPEAARVARCKLGYTSQAGGGPSPAGPLPYLRSSLPAPPNPPGFLLSKRFPASARPPAGSHKNPENRTRLPETRSEAPRGWRGALAPPRMRAVRAAAESHATPPSSARLRHNTGRGKFPKPRENALPTHLPTPGRLGVRPKSRRAGPRQVSVPCGSRRACPGAEGKVRLAREAGRGGGGGGRVAGGGRPGTLTHAPGRLPVALRAWYFPEM